MEIKTKRTKLGGILNGHAYLLKQVDDILLDVRLFYRYGTIYHTYLLDYKEIEGCEILKVHRIVKYSNPLADLVVQGIKQCCPRFNHPCPYLPGYFNGTVDINGTVAPYLPPVVPAGKV